MTLLVSHGRLISEHRNTRTARHRLGKLRRSFWPSVPSSKLNKSTNSTKQWLTSKRFSFPNLNSERWADVKVGSESIISPFVRSRIFSTLNLADFTHVQKLSSGINGDVYKYVWHPDQHEMITVAVKKLRNTSFQTPQSSEAFEKSLHFDAAMKQPSAEDAWTEITVLSYLSCQPGSPVSLLRMLGVFSECQGQSTWLVTEFADGGELFDVARRGVLSQLQIQAYSKQLVKAVEYLHRHRIGHRDISLENVLLKDGIVKLMDFGMAVCLVSCSGNPLRYFREVGKKVYRSPECYVPPSPCVVVTAPLTSCPNDVVLLRVDCDFLCEVQLPSDMQPGKSCMADVIGYTVGPADMFAVGICIFSLAFQCPPWDCARRSNSAFAYFIQKMDLNPMLHAWDKHPLCQEAMLMLTLLLGPDPSRRPVPTTCLEHPWLGKCDDQGIR